MKNIFALEMHQRGDGDQQVQECCRSHRALSLSAATLPANQTMKPAHNVNGDKINAAIDEWAESLVAIIEASDHPEASLLRAHLAIAAKHKELEKMAWRELEMRQDRSVQNG
jgi:hypothetical protein